jgi:hypothetical protein
MAAAPTVIDTVSRFVPMHPQQTSAPPSGQLDNARTGWHADRTLYLSIHPAERYRMCRDSQRPPPPKIMAAIASITSHVST